MAALEEPDEPTRIGVREVRQNLSTYLRRIEEDGERFVITDRGRPVARLEAVPAKPRTWLQQLVADGVIPEPRPIDFTGFVPSKLPPGGPSIVDEVLRERDEDPR